MYDLVTSNLMYLQAQSRGHWARHRCSFVDRLQRCATNREASATGLLLGVDGPVIGGRWVGFRTGSLQAARCSTRALGRALLLQCATFSSQAGPVVEPAVLVSLAHMHARLSTEFPEVPYTGRYNTSGTSHPAHPFVRQYGGLKPASTHQQHPVTSKLLRCGVLQAARTHSGAPVFMHPPQIPRP